MSELEVERLKAYSRLPPRLEREYPEVARQQLYDRYGNAERLDTLLALFRDRKLGRIVDLGGNAGYFCLSLIDAGIADSATVYDVSENALDGGRSMARLMGLSQKIEYVHQPLNLAFVQSLPPTETFICSNLMHHAGIKFDKELVEEIGFPAYARLWLQAMRSKASTAIVGMGFELKRPIKWKHAFGMRPASFARIAVHAGWHLRYDANVLDLQKMGMEASDGRYTRGTALHRPLRDPGPRHRKLIKFSERTKNSLLLDQIVNKRGKYHLYVLDSEQLDHVIVVAGVSGSGKDRLIDALKSSKRSALLPDLPNDVQDWPVLRSLKNPVLPNSRRVIVHYDMNSSNAERGFENDLSLAALAIAKRVTVIMIKTPLDRVVAQLNEREQTRARNATGPIPAAARTVLPFAKRYLPESLADTIQRKTPEYAKRRQDIQAAKIAAYGDPRWATDLFSRWDAYLDGLSASVDRIDIEADDAGGWKPFEAQAHSKRREASA